MTSFALIQLDNQRKKQRQSLNLVADQCKTKNSRQPTGRHCPQRQQCDMFTCYMFEINQVWTSSKTFQMLTSGQKKKKKIIKTFLVLATQSTRSIEITAGEGRQIDKKIAAAMLRRQQKTKTNKPRPKWRLGQRKTLAKGSSFLWPFLHHHKVHFHKSCWPCCLSMGSTS